MKQNQNLLTSKCWDNSEDVSFGVISGCIILLSVYGQT